MNSTRLRKLLEYLEEEPNNPFLIYGVAMEYAKVDYEKGKGYFEDLLKNHPEYLPTYYTYAHMLWDENDLDRAAEVFKKGISLAENKEEHKALHELKAAFYNFKMENDY